MNQVSSRIEVGSETARSIRFLSANVGDGVTFRPAPHSLPQTGTVSAALQATSGVLRVHATLTGFDFDLTADQIIEIVPAAQREVA